MTTAYRLRPDRRREIILEAAVRVLRRDGRDAVTCRAVAAECVIPTGTSTVKYYYGNREILNRHIRAFAKRRGIALGS